MTMPQRCSCRWVIPVQAPYKGLRMDRIFRLNPSHRIRNRTSTPYPRFARKWVAAELRERR
jgi:hypothetical protein